MLSGRRFLATYNAAKVLRKYPVGANLHGFEVTEVLPIKGLSMTAVKLNHLRTGAQHLHIDKDDKNNVFAIGFKTNPPDATGLPHILEHTTLCGSENYPVRDPFFKMLNRSLSNFMNAMTAHDHTFYPFSTTNRTDYKNLQDVYLDATFNPLLQPQDFLQEGWRLEHADVNDKTSPLVYKGVVYNEMKGQLANPNYLFWIKFQEAIYPSLNNSGGDPQAITSLDYIDLVDFQKKNYHPSNAKTFTYGNFSLNDSLQNLDEKYKFFGKKTITNDIKEPLKFTEDITVEAKGNVDQMLPADKQLKASMTWIMGDPADVYQSFLLKILGNLLLDGHSSPLYQALVESGIGFDYSVNSGVESTTAANFFTVGLQGISDTSYEKVVYDVLKKYSEESFPQEKIDAIVQQLELSRKDIKSDFGMTMLYGLMPGWMNKTDPFDSLMFDEILTQFKSEPITVFQDLIKEMLSKPVFKFRMNGVDTFNAELDAGEAKRLEEAQKTLNEQDREIIYERGLKLQEQQNAVEDLSSLPSLSVNDIDRDGSNYPVNIANNIYSKVTGTNGITYIRSKQPLNNIPYELYPLLPLFADSLTSLGTSTEAFSEIEDKIKLHTGGVSASIGVISSPHDTTPQLTFNMSGFALNSKVDHVYEFWGKLLQTDFVKHKEKLRTLVKSIAASTNIAESGHSFARNFTGASISTTKAIGDSLAGMKQLQLINQIVNDEQKFEEVVQKLQTLQKLILAGGADARFLITTDSATEVSNNTKLIEKFVQDKHSQEATFPPSEFSKYTNKQTLLKFPFQVSYASSSMTGVPYTHEDGAPLQVLANLLTFKHLHKEIREKGGAYGGGAVYSALDGIFSFYSYRDPNAMKSIETFHEARNFNAWKQQDLDEAKLTIFQGVDAPISPKSEGTLFFGSDVNDEMRQMRREELLDVTLDDVARVSDKYLRDPVDAVVGESAPEHWEVLSVE